LQLSVALLSEASKLVKNSRRASNPEPTSLTRSFQNCVGADMPSIAFPDDGGWVVGGCSVGFAAGLGAADVALTRSLRVVGFPVDLVVDARVFAEDAGVAADFGIVPVIGGVVGVRVPGDFWRALLG
jgi:hypothetical protein